MTLIWEKRIHLRGADPLKSSCKTLVDMVNDPLSDSNKMEACTEEGRCVS